MRQQEGSSWRAERFSVRMRHRLSSGVLRLRGGWWQILQTAVAATIAWALAVLLLGPGPPEFAPIAAVISLGLAVDQRARRAVELTFGVAFGVVLADLLVSVMGVGALQAGGLVVLAMAAAVFLGRGELGVNEAAISAMILMITFHSPDTIFPPDRFFEALIGGGTALLVNALLPLNPERMVEEAAHPVFDESVATLEEIAGALDEDDLERAQGAVIKSREIDARVSGFKEALAAGHETARFAPPRRRSLQHLELYAAAADQIDLTVRDVRELARAALGVVHSGVSVPEPLPRALRELARATEAMAVRLETSGSSEDACRFALEAAGRASSLLKEREDMARNLAINGLVDHIHSAAGDILLGAGMDREEALRMLQKTIGRARDSE